MGQFLKLINLFDDNIIIIQVPISMTHYSLKLPNSNANDLRVGKRTLDMEIVTLIWTE